MTLPSAAWLLSAVLVGAPPPPPTIEPIEPIEPGIEFAVPPPEIESETETDTDIEGPALSEETSPLAEPTWPDPGSAPNDGNAMLVLGTATLTLTGTAMGLGLTLGLDKKVPLQYLLPATIIPGTLASAFGIGSLYVGAKRARAHRQWEIGYRVVGEPQGGGLMYAGMISVLGALGMTPLGATRLDLGDTKGGGTLIALGSAAAVAAPILLVVGKRRANRYDRTGGWHRRPLPPIPTQNQTRLQITPLVAPTLGGFMIGASGRF